MSNNEAPERIWVWHHEGGFFEWPSVHLEKPSTEVFKSVEYIRADLVAELEAERDALRKQYADLYEAASYRDFDLMEHPAP